MSKGKWWIVVLAIIVIILVGSGIFFVKTGGVGLSRVTWNYLLRDIPDKKYSWRDFTDRGTEQGISGFYAFGNENGFSMWTLSGLKTFLHAPGTSIYQHEDICAAVRKARENPEPKGTAIKADKDIIWDLPTWQSLIQQENLVTVLRLSPYEQPNVIDKVWSYSGIYKELNKLDQETCK